MLIAVISIHSSGVEMLIAVIPTQPSWVEMLIAVNPIHLSWARTSIASLVIPLYRTGTKMIIAKMIIAKKVQCIVGSERTACEQQIFGTDRKSVE